jgi:hypothetical protein
MYQSHKTPSQLYKCAQIATCQLPLYRQFFSASSITPCATCPISLSSLTIWACAPLFPISPPIHLISVQLRTKTIPDGRNKRMQLREERNRPHDIHGGSREDERRAPDTVERSPSAHVTLTFLFSIQSSSRSQYPLTPAPDGIERANSRLVLALGRKEPRCAAEDGDYHKPDEWGPAALLSVVLS